MVLLCGFALFAVFACANTPGKSLFGGGGEKKEEPVVTGEESSANAPAPMNAASEKTETEGAVVPAPEVAAEREDAKKGDPLTSPPVSLAPPKPRALPSSAGKDYVVLGGSGATANIRSGPGVDYAVVGQFPEEARFELIGESKEFYEGKPWYRILDQNGNDAYVWSGLVEKVRGEKRSFGAPLSPFERLKTGDRLTPPVPEELKQTKELSLNFEAVEIREIIQTFSELLKLNYIIEPGISGEITLHTSNKIPVQNLFTVFEQILTLNNISMVKKGAFYHFLPMPEAKRTPIDLYHGKSKVGIPDEDRLIIQIIPLNYVLAKSVQATVAPLLSKNAHFISLENTNTLIIMELASSMRRLVDIINALDVNNIESADIEIFSITYSDAMEVGKTLQDVFTNLGYQSTGPLSLKFTPIKSLNSILVVNKFPNLLPVVESWIKKLDQPQVEGKTATFVYYLQNAEAGNMASLLKSIYGEKKSKKEEELRLRRTRKEEGAAEQKPAVVEKKEDVEKKEEKKAESAFAPQPKVEGSLELSTAEIEGEINIIADTDTNALIIRTNPKNYPAIEDTIKKLDRMPLQVLIEVLIMDVTLTEETKFGVEWSLKGAMAQKDWTFDSKSSQGLFSDGLPILSETAGTWGLAVTGTDKVMAMIEAFGSDSKANVLSTPIVITSENKPSSISITDQIPITSGKVTSGVSDYTTETVEYKDVGIKLTVTPKINDQRFVVLKVSQEVSGWVDDSSGGNPRFYSRNAETNVVVKDKETIILGGLMQTQKSNTKTGIPYLSKIPVFGKLFGSQKDKMNKSELLIFITPHVIINTQEGNVVTREFREKLKLLKEETQQIKIGGGPEEAPVGP